MSFRRRLTLACAAAVAVAVVLAAGVTYVVVARRSCAGRSTRSLHGAPRCRWPENVSAAERRPTGSGAASPSGAQAGSPLDGPSPSRRCSTPKADALPAARPASAGAARLARDVAAVAAGRRGAVLRDDERSTARTCACSRPGARRRRRCRSRARSTRSTRRCGTLRLGLGWDRAARRRGGARARAAGHARGASSRCAELTATAEHVARTRDLTPPDRARTATTSSAASAAAFNTMLEALDDSQRAQRRLVADASHELRTPLTSLRTNLEVSARGGLAAGRPRAAARRPVAQLEELTVLVGDLVDLAREEEPVAERRGAAPRRARRGRGRAGAPPRPAGAVRDASWSRALVEGVRSRLDRAVANLLDNAAKWSPPARRSR